MIVIPRETPVVSNLHTSYIRIRRFVDHFRNALPSGCVYLRAPGSEGAVYFDQGALINAHICADGESRGRQPALEELLRTADAARHTVSVFEIPEESIGYWANLNEAALIHKNLTSSTVDLEALMKKIIQDRFTGLIEVLNPPGKADQIHVIMGEIAGAVLGKSGGILRDPNQELGRIMTSAKNERTRIAIKRVQLEALHLSDACLHDKEPTRGQARGSLDTQNPVEMLEVLLGVFEQTYADTKIQTDPFDTVLKRKFLEKVSRYEFLDPFTEEFSYQGGAITYTGTDKVQRLVAAVTECLRELALERGLGMELQQNLKSWRQQYQREIDAFKAVV
ncbi:DUF4388 domain-containing protein [Desulfoluna spongiiphila]|uniref:DUF4388 domain-containing protein n=1 Tax=Desulfoluna spongiiphila TaxID=419481 RepID=UPI001258AFD5|nr:DUF4388 domain-containing protein [Desulfoluna spongiiphila]VVS95496.1 hypothetical protein DBB_50730 [Desulfoluna spongiiphila]